MNDIVCIFCEEKMKENEKFREDYGLIAWRDDKEEPESFNKLAKPAHFHCFGRFLELNNLCKWDNKK